MRNLRRHGVHVAQVDVLQPAHVHAVDAPHRGHLVLSALWTTREQWGVRAAARVLSCTGFINSAYDRYDNE